MKMRALLCTVATCLASAGAAMGQIVQWPLNNENGCTAGAPVVAPGITASFICRGAGLTFTSGTAGRNYISSNWTVGGTDADAVTNNDYLEFTVTPDAGFKATLTDVTIRPQRSNSGPQTMAIRSSLDGYTATIATIVVPTSVAARTFDFADFDTCAAVTFRIYGYGATGTGTGRLEATLVGGTDGIVVNGTVAAGTCTDVRACCVAGTCVGVIDQASCSSQNGFWGSLGSTCGTLNCTTIGACCFPLTGACSLLTSADCTTQSGNWGGPTAVCVPNTCPLPSGGCCIGGICSIDATQQDCTGSGGVWLGANVACNQGVNCIAPTGACCLADGTCTDGLTSTACTGQGGIYRGDASLCSGVTCLYACCFADGTCTVVSRTACSTAGGTPGANNSQTCSPNGCPQPVALGACCVGTNCTAGQSYADCNTAGGIWLGKGTLCTGTPCNQASAPTLVAKYDFDVNRQGTQTITTDAAAPVGDAFNPVQRFHAWPEPFPFALLDDSVTLFPFVDLTNRGDSLGVIPESKVDTAFGVADVYNIIITDSTRDAVAKWDFNVAGRTNLSFNLDIAAMGNFETLAGCSVPPCVDDRYIITWQLDAGAETTVFDARADEAATANYTVAGGQVFAIDDPLKDTVSSTYLTNTFTNFNFPVPGTGTTLTIRLKSNTDGGDEAFALDNIMVMADAVVVGPTPCQIADFDDNGSVSVNDLFAFLSAWFAQNGGAPGMPSADIDGNNAVSVNDLFAFLALWFQYNGTSC